MRHRVQLCHFITTSLGFKVWFSFVKLIYDWNKLHLFKIIVSWFIQAFGPCIRDMILNMTWLYIKAHNLYRRLHNNCYKTILGYPLLECGACKHVKCVKMYVRWRLDILRVSHSREVTGMSWCRSWHCHEPFLKYRVDLKLLDQYWKRVLANNPPANIPPKVDQLFSRWGGDNCHEYNFYLGNALP